MERLAQHNLEPVNNTEDAHRISKVEQIAQDDETVHLILAKVQVGHANDVRVLFLIL
jgi:hypothetical protein